MPPKLTKTIIGAVIAVALAAAVSYGVISQQTADQIQTKANETLQTDQAAPDQAPQQPQPTPDANPPTPSQPGTPPRQLAPRP